MSAISSSHRVYADKVGNAMDGPPSKNVCLVQGGGGGGGGLFYSV